MKVDNPDPHRITFFMKFDGSAIDIPASYVKDHRFRSQPGNWPF
jgi:hypothetical protein